jgi:hypothetical protein
MKKYLPISILLSFIILLGAGCDVQPGINYSLPVNSQSVHASTSPSVIEKIIPVVTPSVNKPAIPKTIPDSIQKSAPKPKPGAAPNGTYTNTAGNKVPRPYDAPSVPIGASAQCRDGTYSFSQSRRGTCSHHGGVAEWF